MKVFLAIIFILNVFASSVATAKEDFGCNDDDCKSTFISFESLISTISVVTTEESRPDKESGPKGSCSDCGCHSRHLFSPILFETIKSMIPSRLSEVGYYQMQQLTINNYCSEIMRPPIV